jgi:hypothetical protein
LDCRNTNKKIMTTLWINKDYLVENSILDENVDFSKMQPVIKLVQNRYIERLIGTSMFNLINDAITAYINNSTTIPTRIQTILDKYIYDIIAYYFLMESSDVLKWRYAQKGIKEKTSTDSASISKEELRDLEYKWKNHADWYGTELLKYLRFYSATYPEFTTISNSTYTIQPMQSSIDIPIYLEGGSYVKANRNEGDVR